jgi:hypothetical protein
MLLLNSNKSKIVNALDAFFNKAMLGSDFFIAVSFGFLLVYQEIKFQIDISRKRKLNKKRVQSRFFKKTISLY